LEWNPSSSPVIVPLNNSWSFFEVNYLIFIGVLFLSILMSVPMLAYYYALTT